MIKAVEEEDNRKKTIINIYPEFLSAQHEIINNFFLYLSIY